MFQKDEVEAMTKIIKEEMTSVTTSSDLHICFRHPWTVRP